MAMAGSVAILVQDSGADCGASVMFSLVKLARGGLEAPEALQPRPGVEMATPRLPIAGSLVNLAMGGLEAPEALQPDARSVARPVVEMDTPRRPVASLVEMALGVFKPAVAVHFPTSVCFDRDQAPTRRSKY